MLLSKLVSPDGKIIQSERSSDAKQNLSERITVIETRLEYIEKERR